MTAASPLRPPTPAPQLVPILLYHSVSASPPAWIAPFTVAPDVFEQHLDLILASGCTPLTVSGLVDRLRHRRGLPERPMVVTFDDGFADTAEVAGPALARRGLPATVYVTTGPGRGASHCLPPARMMTRAHLTAADRCGLEIGAHSDSHRPLDVLQDMTAGREIEASKAWLEDALGRRVRSFAYPHGYYDAPVAAMVEQAGFDSACAVKNAMSSTRDDRYALARLTVRASTPIEQLRRWLHGQGAPVAWAGQRWRTRAWRQYRRLAASRRQS
jgi:peptidoglycan/xylan/chitin deacetylase (PgdA/CDA1 family)